MKTIIVRFFKSLLLLFLLTGACLICLEWLVRVFLPTYHPAGRIHFIRDHENDVVIASRDFQGRQWKNTGDFDVAISINRHGFRDKKSFDKQTSQGIFVVGDSFSFGWGVEETERFSNQLETTLRTPVYNIATPTNIEGYSRLVHYAQQNGAQVNQLIIGICMENDLLDYQFLMTQSSQAPDKLQYAYRFTSRKAIKSLLSRHSALYGAVTSAVHKNPALKSIMVQAGWIIDNFDGMNRNQYNEKIIQSSTDRLLKLINQNQIEQHLIVLIPSRALWIGGNEKTERLVHRQFVSSLMKHRLNVIDLKPLFERIKNPLSYHFANDGHWNKLGHSFAAQSIAEHIETHQLFIQSRKQNNIPFSRFRK